MNEVVVPRRSTAGRAAWTCLIIAWVFFILPIPGFGIIGWMLNLVAFILAIVAMAQSGAMAGLWQLLASLIISPIVYWVIGMGLMVGLLGLGAARMSG